MNAVTEQDLDLLDEYLDGALPPADAERVRDRLGREPQLAAALEGVGAERAARTAVWRSLEPGDDETERFAARVRVAARRQAAWGRVGRSARFGSAAAACLLVGYVFGWANHDRGGPDGGGGTGRGGVNPVSVGGGNGGSRPATIRYRVSAGFDGSGRPIIREFDNLEDLRRFADDVRQRQEPR